MRKKLIVGLAALTALGLAATTAFAVVGINASYVFSPNKANKSAGVSVNYVITDPAAIQPPVNNRIQISFAKGPKGCPSKSKLGTGTGVGYAKPVVTDPVNAKLTIFNGGSTILVYVFPDLGPTFVVTCKIIGGYNLDCTIPPIKTLPSAPDAATGTVNTKTTPKSIKKGKKKLGLIITPKKCKGSWKTSAVFSFTTGEKVTTNFSEKCKK